MKQYHILLLMILLIDIVLISGCAEQAQEKAATSPQTEDGTSAPVETKTNSGCTSPYEGTYSGLVSGSGEVTHRKKDANGLFVDTKTPYIVTYNLEITLKCTPNTGIMEVTHAKVSDTFFDCTNGCTPLQAEESSSHAVLSPPGTAGGEIVIYFPNGKEISIFPIIADSDAKTLRIDRSDGYLVSNIGSIIDWGTSYQDCIETRSCPNCVPVPLKEGISMTLDKIS